MQTRSVSSNIMGHCGNISLRLDISKWYSISGLIRLLLINIYLGYIVLLIQFSSFWVSSGIYSLLLRNIATLSYIHV